MMLPTSCKNEAYGDLPFLYQAIIYRLRFTASVSISSEVLITRALD